MAILSFWHRIAAVALLTRAVYAQTSTPTQVFTAGQATCTNGLANTAAPAGGTYTDTYGAFWNIECAQDSTGVSYDNAGTNGAGMYSCFSGCDRRVACTGFTYIGTVTGMIRDR